MPHPAPCKFYFSLFLDFFSDTNFSVQLSPQTIKQNIVFIAQQLGFDDCRIAAAKPATHGKRFLEWLDQGCAGDMQWLERNPTRRTDPREVLEGAKTIITLALNYYPGELSSTLSQDYKIARYSWNDDYHKLIEDRLKEFDLAIQDLGGRTRYYVDTGPVLERDFASDAGLGWNGKSTVQIHPRLGTWFFLCELITDLDIEPDTPLSDHCGKCTRCIAACPTNAITAPREMDARRCISYLTIEHRGSIPVALRPLIGDRLYGCDICLEACPWNRFAKLSSEASFHARESIFKLSLDELLQLDEETFNSIFARSPIRRIKRERFLRNACIVAGNSGDRSLMASLEALLREPSDLLQEHARWAIERLQQT